MSSGRHGPRLLRDSRSPPHPLWHRDHALSTVAWRYAHGNPTRRHVAFTPGPLEARKRAGGRRMVNVVQSAPAERFDPTLLAGIKKDVQKYDYQWQSPTQDFSQTQLEPLNPISWFAGFPWSQDLIPSLQFKAAEDEDQYDAKEELDPPFFEKFTTCEDLEALRRLCSQTNVDLRSYSRVAFRHLLVSEQLSKALLALLEDPSLEDPKARNLRFLLKQQYELCKTTEDRVVFLEPMKQWVKRQLGLGNLSNEQVLHLSEFVALLQEESIRCDWLDAILQGLESSPIFNLQDLGLGTIINILGSITRGVHTQRSQHIGYRLLNTLKPALPRQMINSVSTFILRGMQSQASLQQGEQSHASEPSSIANAIMLIQRLPLDEARSIMILTSEAMIRNAAGLSINKMAWLKIMDEWWSSLANSGLFTSMQKAKSIAQFECIMGSQRLEVLASYLRHCNNQKKAFFLSKQWFTASQDLGEHERSGRSCKPFFKMLRAAQYYSGLREQLVAKFFRLLQLMQMSDVVVDIISGSRSEHIDIPIQAVLDAIQSHLSVSSGVALSIYNSDPRLRLAEEMIRDPTIHPKDIWTDERERAWAREDAVFFEGSKSLWLVRVFLIERMAIACAQAQHLSHQVAFRNVFQCYSRIKGYSSPVSTVIARALSMTGIVRPLQCGRWIGTEKLRWILKIIRQAEGPEIADEVDQLVFQWHGENARNKASERKNKSSLSQDYHD